MTSTSYQKHKVDKLETHIHWLKDILLQIHNDMMMQQMAFYYVFLMLLSETHYIMSFMEIHWRKKR